MVHPVQTVILHTVQSPEGMQIVNHKVNDLHTKTAHDVHCIYRRGLNWLYRADAGLHNASALSLMSMLIFFDEFLEKNIW